MMATPYTVTPMVGVALAYERLNHLILPQKHVETLNRLRSDYLKISFTSLCSLANRY